MISSLIRLIRIFNGQWSASLIAGWCRILHRQIEAHPTSPVHDAHAPTIQRSSPCPKCTLGRVAAKETLTLIYTMHTAYKCLLVKSPTQIQSLTQSKFSKTKTEKKGYRSRQEVQKNPLHHVLPGNTSKTLPVPCALV